jgi:hypothetical protein
MAADPAKVAARLADAASDTEAAADLVFNLCTDFRAGRQVEPLDPASLVADTAIPETRKAGLELLNTAIREEYGRDLHELSDEDAWRLLDALAAALADLARGSHHDDIESKLTELRQLSP